MATAALNCSILLRVLLFVLRFNRALPIYGLLMTVLVGCSSPTEVEKMQEAQHALLTDAMDLQRCESANGYWSEKCTGQRKAYESDLAAFKATYSK